MKPSTADNLLHLVGELELVPSAALNETFSEAGGHALDAAVVVDDLRFPPGNHLEALKGDRAGQHSVRINDQWRICFRWTEHGPADVEIVDYH